MVQNQTFSHLLVSHIDNLNYSCSAVLFPDRRREGYGLNKDVLEIIFSKFEKGLLITLDCGITNYEEVKIDNFLGSTYAKTRDKSIEKNPDTIYAYKPFVKYKYEMHHYNECDEAEIIDMKYADTKLDKYLVFLSSGDSTWAVISTDNKNGKKLLVIKDSYGNSFVPFLLPHYEEIYVIDPRFYDFNTIGMDVIDFIHNKGINELLFVNYMENVNYKEYMHSLDNLMGQD